MQLLFRRPAPEAAGLLVLPWDTPLAEWDERLLVEVPQRGISRHEVRFAASGGGLYALKETRERLARREFALLEQFEDDGLPSVSVLGVCVNRADTEEAILVTRYLESSASYRWLFSGPGCRNRVDGLLDGLVGLIVRLHLSGVYWGDCSLSNTLLRSVGGTPEVFLVDAETAERYPTLSPAKRAYDVELARERVGAELLDLRCGGLLPAGIDPVEVADGLRPRYDRLWQEAPGSDAPDRGGRARSN